MSLKIYYTGSDNAGESQADPSASLGGFVSSSEVPNDFLGNLFPAISELSKSEQRSDVRVIAVQNNSGADFVSFQVYIDNSDLTPEELETEWELGYASYTLDDCGDLISEELPNPQATPLNITMADGFGPNKAITLPNISDQSYVSIYIKRTVKNTVLDDTTLEDNFEDSVMLPNNETMDLIFSWT